MCFFLQSTMTSFVIRGPMSGERVLQKQRHAIVTYPAGVQQSRWAIWKHSFVKYSVGQLQVPRVGYVVNAMDEVGVSRSRSMT